MVPDNIGLLSPRVILLHWLGGSARTWTEVVDGLAERGVRPSALDLPGFGLANAETGFSIDAMVEKVISAIQGIRAGEEEIPWLIVGHSMGGKIACCVARAAADGRSGLESLAGMILISPSPPGPEPMAEDKRRELLETLGRRVGEEPRAASARKFIEDNIGDLPLDASVRARSVDDVLRSSPAAFAAWLTTGSKQDVSVRVGELAVPTLVLAGTRDEALGPDPQRKHTLRHFTAASLQVLEHSGHLAPLECPIDLMDRITVFMHGLGLPLSKPAVLNLRFEALIASDQVSPKTREVLQSRLKAEVYQGPKVLDEVERETLIALCARVIPQCSFDLADRVEERLASGQSDGWRDDRLPADIEGWRSGIRTLDVLARRTQDTGFSNLSGAQQDALLRQIREKALKDRVPGGASSSDLNSQIFNADQMQAWFEDVRGELAKIYMADPRTMEEIGFTGFADEKGFTRIRLGELEDFER